MLSKTLREKYFGRKKYYNKFKNKSLCKRPKDLLSEFIETLGNSQTLQGKAIN